MQCSDYDNTTKTTASDRIIGLRFPVFDAVIFKNMEINRVGSIVMRNSDVAGLVHGYFNN